MKKASISETKANLSALLDGVREGNTVLILDRGRPVARLESVVTTGEEPVGRLARLERRGLLRRGQGAPPELWRTPAPEPAGGASALDALLEERRGGR